MTALAPPGNSGTAPGLSPATRNRRTNTVHDLAGTMRHSTAAATARVQPDENKPWGHDAQMREAKSSHRVASSQPCHHEGLRGAVSFRRTAMSGHLQWDRDYGVAQTGSKALRPTAVPRDWRCNHTIVRSRVPYRIAPKIDAVSNAGQTMSRSVVGAARSPSIWADQGEGLWPRNDSVNR